MKPIYYLLEGTKVVPTDDIVKWGNQFHSGNQFLFNEDALDGVSVSTVFLGQDMGFRGSPPLIFETMIFVEGGPPGYDVLDYRCWRWSTYEEAEAGHKALVYALKNSPMDIPEGRFW